MATDIKKLAIMSPILVFAWFAGGLFALSAAICAVALVLIEDVIAG